MKHVLIYDLPQRIFHWLFALLFLTSFVIGKTVDDESIIFGYHMISGILMSALVILRIFWGFVGNKHSRFSSMPLKLEYLIDYFKNIFNKDAPLFPGHNPASAYASIVMYVLSLLLALSGFQMINLNSKHFFEEVHEVVAHLFLLIVILHVAGIILHTMKKKDRIGIAMVTGFKQQVDEKYKISSNSIGVAFVLMVLFFGLAGYLFKKFDTRTGKLELLSRSYNLVEIEDDGFERENDDE